MTSWPTPGCACGARYWPAACPMTAACVSAPMFVLLGKHFGGEITHLIHVAHRAQGMVFGTVALLGGVYFLIQRRKKARLATGLGAVDVVA